MFEKLFKDPITLRRHKTAIYVEDRKRFLIHLAKQGYAHNSLMHVAKIILWVVCEFDLSPDTKVPVGRIQAATRRWAHRQYRLEHICSPKWTRHCLLIATRWLRFLGHLYEPPPKPTPFPGVIEDFTAWMDQERGLSSSTINIRCRNASQFLRWYETKGRPIAAVQVADIDTFLSKQSTRGWSRRSVAICTHALRAFFRFAKMRGWCPSSIADAIQGPRLYAEELLPMGPIWEDVRRLINSMETDRLPDIRDRALVMLFAIYGLRASEVSNLQLEDIDWERDLLMVRRSKQRRSQTYPLISVVGNAIIRYLRMVRPQCSLRNVFLTLMAPFRPLSVSGLSTIVNHRMERLEIRVPHRGAHSLRHACAAHLVAEGFSLKEIGDHLGHRSPAATRIYAKVDLPGLRQVAAFDLGGLL